MRRYAALLALLALLLTTGCTPFWSKDTPADPPPVSTPVTTPIYDPAPPVTPTLPPGTPDPNQRPAINEGDTVTVGLPSNDCLNLRGDHSTNARIAACLPGGTKLSVQKPAQGPHVDWWDGEWWLYVKTDKGDKGWVAVTAGKVTRTGPAT